MRDRTLTLKNYRNNEFVVFFFITVIVLVFFMSLAPTLFRVVFILFVTLHIFLAFNITLKKSAKRIKDEKMKAVLHLSKIKMKLNFLFSFWVAGVIFIFYAFFLLYIYNDFLLIGELEHDTVIYIAQTGIVLASFLIAGAFLVRAVTYGYSILRLMRFMSNAGFVLLLASLFYISYPFIYGNYALIERLFYMALFLGVLFLIIEESSVRNMLSVFLLLGVLGLLSVVFFVDLVFFVEFFFYRFSDFVFVSLIDIISVLEQLIFIFLFFGVVYYVVNYPQLKTREQLDEEYRSKHVLEQIIQVLMMTWVCLIAFYIISVTFYVNSFIH